MSANKLNKKEYGELVSRRAPSSGVLKNVFLAFASGGLICCAGQAFFFLYSRLGLDEESSRALMSVTLVFLGALLTALHVYDRLAKHAGAGTLVPITGFANSIAAAALEFKSEGLITGMAAKMFVIAGPVLVFGVAASAVYGVIYCIIK
ncbi:MAG: SpoVA/SpoVAEb family sporulation membrane protein [Oscillospiraceae bacterium]|jgi:stage V sporulation protein AC|nr:SpoVA/SpoVAEb family sporulation membrane protein [Oscillospiraceae bacterium]